MKKSTVREAVEILRQLTPANQAYFMTLVRVAGEAEKNGKNAEAAERQNESFKQPRWKKARQRKGAPRVPDW